MKVSIRKDSLSFIILLRKPKLIAIELQYLISGLFIIVYTSLRNFDKM